MSIGNQTISNTNGIIVRHVTTAGTNSVNWRAIKVDNKVLVDAGVIPVGSLNSSVYNDDQTWSSGWSGQSGTYGRVPTNAFNGDLSNWAFAGNNGANEYVEYSFTAIDVNTSLEFYLSFDAGGSQRGQLWVNDTNVTSQLGSGNAQWYTVTGQSTLSKIKILTTATNYYVNLHAVKVDGKILVDSNQTPANVPSIASTVRANPTAGFSIVSWQGTANATVAHSLGGSPELVITKSRDNGVAWRIWSPHFSNTSNQYLGFDTNGAGTFGGTYWGTMDSNVLGMGAGTYDNNNGDMIAYCFRSIEGYSALSSYTSTGTNNFIYTGFRPAFLICKKLVNSVAPTYEGWVMFDSERGSYNINQESLYANRNYVEGKRGQDSTIGSTFGVDFLSNGFCFKDNATEYNRADSSTYIYYAVAENPFKIARAA